MMRKTVVVIALIAAIGGLGPDRLRAQSRKSGPAEQIVGLLRGQAAAWNRGDIRAFMSGYWKSEKTEFVGSSGVVRGWQNVLDRYLRTYPNRAAMGRLTFSGLEVQLLCPGSAYVLGHWKLMREKDQPEGDFTLILRKFPEGWRIVHDHTSQEAMPEGAGKPS